jgi:hypothetical protein
LDWFERLTGFPETDYPTTRARLAVEGRTLVSRVTGQRHGIGELELVSLGELRRRAAAVPGGDGPLRLGFVSGDVRALHQDPAYEGALFQVASQFNLLEMVHERITPEDGVTRYEADRTQGPACAIAAGAATVYRNYFVPVDGQPGQTRDRQLDGLADLGAALSREIGMPVARMWSMRNGYALCTADGLAAIEGYLLDADDARRNRLREHLRIGLHRGVEVTDAPGPRRPRVSQAFCSALPVAYGDLPAARWAPFARLVLEAAYEATLLAGVLNAGAAGGSPVVALTRLGGGAFGNDGRWIDDALRRATLVVAGRALDVRIVTTSPPSPALRALERRLAAADPHDALGPARGLSTGTDRSIEPSAGRPGGRDTLDPCLRS